MRGILWCAALLAVVPCAASAEQVSIAPMSNVDLGEIDAISAECEVKVDSMVCNLVQISVRGAKTDEEIEAEVANRLAQAIAEFGDPEKRAQMEFCDPSKRTALLEQTKAAASKPENKGKEYFLTKVEELALAFETVCENPNELSVKEFLRWGIQSENEICSVWSNPFTQTFQLQANGSWISNEGPFGTCGTVNISTLRKDPEASKYDFGFASPFWIYETRRIITAPVASDARKSCPLAEHAMMYSWKQQQKPRRCETVQFGF